MGPEWRRLIFFGLIVTIASNMMRLLLLLLGFCCWQNNETQHSPNRFALNAVFILLESMKSSQGICCYIQIRAHTHTHTHMKRKCVSVRRIRELRVENKRNNKVLMRMKSRLTWLSAAHCFFFSFEFSFLYGPSQTLAVKVQCILFSLLYPSRYKADDRS